MPVPGSLVKSGVYDSLLREVNRQLEAHHVMVTTGVIVDASVTDSHCRPKGQKEYEVVEDRHEDEGADIANTKLVEKPRPGIDAKARWVKKAGICHFGYKQHTVVNQDGLVIAEETTIANESDIKHLAAPLEKADLERGTLVMVDKGYDLAENMKSLSDKKLKCRTCTRRRRTAS